MQIILWALSVIVALFIGGFLKSYLSKKGENLATHEDINRLVEQVRAVTQTTKEIESKISGELWDRQKRWELRRDLLLDLLRRTTVMSNALTALSSTYTARTQIGRPTAQQEQVPIESNDAWLKAADDYDQAVFVMDAVCGDGITRSALKLSGLCKRIARAIISGNPGEFRNRMEEWTLQCEELRKAARQELLEDKDRKPSRTP